MTRKLILMLLLGVLINQNSNAQSFPAFLEGTWKVAGGNSYEHWDLLSEKRLKGFTFEMEMGLPVISEYLEIFQKGDVIIYEATVLNQNLGQGIPFTLIRQDSVFSFENRDHDFPKIIQYKPVTNEKISVFVGTEDDGFELELLKTGSD